jgi:hypothetical protein
MQPCDEGRPSSRYEGRRESADARFLIDGGVQIRVRPRVRFQFGVRDYARRCQRDGCCRPWIANTTTAASTRRKYTA